VQHIAGWRVFDRRCRRITSMWQSPPRACHAGAPELDARIPERWQHSRSRPTASEMRRRPFDPRKSARVKRPREADVDEMSVLGADEPMPLADSSGS